MPTASHPISKKASSFTESVIREMTRLALEHDAVNLAQGFPNFAAPEWIKEEACRAIREDINQYAITWGAPELRRAVAGKYSRSYGFEVDPESEVTVACGATECMIASILALVNPGDRVLVFEPFYENYGPDAIIAGAVPGYVPLEAEAEWSFDVGRLEETLRQAQSQGGVRALILNTPNNPSGKVFSRRELSAIAKLACRYDFYVITDEIYEHILYDDNQHHLIALEPGMRERTVTISGHSKTFSVTGWRIGYMVAPPLLTGAIRKMHDFLTVGAAAPLQAAAAAALGRGQEYYRELAQQYRRRRDLLLGILRRVGFRVWVPGGAYYIMADIRGVTDLDDVAFVETLIRKIGVAAVPGSSFYHEPKLGRHLVRFAFCKTLDVLEEAGRRLARLTRG